jgi:hypothetical protein
MLRVLPGPQDSPFGAPAEIAVLDPSHPEAPLHAAEALAQLPALAAVQGLRQLAASLALHCVSLAAYPDPEAAFHEFYGLSSHRVWLDSSNTATDPVAGRNRPSIMTDDSGSRGMRAHHANGVTTRVIKAGGCPNSRSLLQLAGQELVQQPGNGSGSSARAGFRPRLAGLPGLRAQARVWWNHLCRMPH